MYTFLFQRHKRVQRFLCLLLVFLLAFALLSSSPASAAPENPPIYPSDNISISTTITPVASLPCVYEVNLRMDAPAQTVYPPIFVTLILDGTTSMRSNVGDSSTPRRDEAVRNASIAFFQTLMSAPTSIRDKVYINVITFGSDVTRARSLTNWANTGTPAFADIDLINDVAVPSENHFVPLIDPMVPGSINPIFTNLFYFDPSTFSAYPNELFGTITTPGYAISNQFYYGNTLESNANRFPIGHGGTFINGAMELAYKDLQKMDTYAKGGGLGALSPDEVQGISKYVLLLCDGNDQSNAATQSWGVALKSMVQSINAFSYTVGTGSSQATVPNAGETVPGLDADIWALIVGNSGYDSTEVNWIANYQNGMIADKVARHMISLATPVHLGVPFGLYANLDSGPPATDWANYYTTYQQVARDNPGFAVGTKFMRSQEDGNDITTFFTDFVVEATQVGGAHDAVAFGTLGNDFNLYQDATHIPSVTLSNAMNKPWIDVSGPRSLNIHMGNIEPGGSAEVTFYVQLKPEYRGDSVLHSIMDELDFIYDGTITSGLLLNFPIQGVYSTCPRDTVNPTPTPTTVPPAVFPTPSPGGENSIPPSFILPNIVVPDTVPVLQIAEENLQEECEEVPVE